MNLTSNLECDRFEYATRRVCALPMSESRLVYDIGAGHAALRTDVESTGRRYVAFDLTGDGADVLRWDLEDPPPVGERAQVVLLLEVIEHLWNPKLCLEHVADSLCPGGHLVMTTPNPRWSRGRFDLLLRHGMSCFTPEDLRVNHHVFTGWPHVIEALLGATGFSVLEYVTLESQLPWPNRPLTFSYPARIIKHGLSRMIESADPASKGMGYGIVARKTKTAEKD